MKKPLWGKIRNHRINILSKSAVHWWINFNHFVHRLKKVLHDRLNIVCCVRIINDNTRVILISWRHEEKSLSTLRKSFFPANLDIVVVRITGQCRYEENIHNIQFQYWVLVQLVSFLQARKTFNVCNDRARVHYVTMCTPADFGDHVFGNGASA